MKIKVYLSSLVHYVEGRENGRWLQLPMETKRLEAIFEEIVGKGKEAIILDYDAPFSINEYENIFALNKFTENLASYSISDDELKALFEVDPDRQGVMNHIENSSFVIINVDAVSSGWSTSLNPEETYGMVLNEEGFNNLFSQPIPEEMIDYMDFAQIFTCLSNNDGWEAVTIENTTYLVRI